MHSIHLSNGLGHSMEKSIYKTIQQCCTPYIFIFYKNSTDSIVVSYSRTASFSLAAVGSVWRQTVAMVRLPCGWCLTQTGPHTVSRRRRGESLCWTCVCVMEATVLFTAPSVQRSHCFSSVLPYSYIYSAPLCNICLMCNPKGQSVFCGF